ncbi:YdcF family protein [Lactobacillus sp. Sy-1]|nr:YdcF family protein [Lactobacillus sp. Sy-1]
MNGFLATISAGGIFMTISLLILSFNNSILVKGYVIFFLILVLIMVLIYFFQGFFWLWNALIVWRRENHTLANMLTLFIGIITLAFPIVNFVFADRKMGPLGTFINAFVSLSILYILFCVISFMAAAMLFTFRKPRPDKQFIIVLGAGLLNGDQVSPLLASRIDKGIQFYHQVVAKTGKAPLMICSGGQGGDETVPEGRAMREYAIQHGIAAEHVVAEDRSKTTLQNMLFSKQIVAAHNLPLNNGIYVSNDYHIFRAGIYAQQAGLNIQGLGAKTSRFFVPNATIREYIALLMNHKKFHLVMFTLILVVSGLSMVLR